MSARARKKRAEPQSFKTSWATHLGRSFVSLVLVVLILYAALLAASRTQGFRSLVAERFEAFTGMDVNVQESKLTPMLRLNIGGMSAGLEESRSVASMRIDELHIQWKPYRLFSRHSKDVTGVKVIGVEVNIQRKDEVLPACMQWVANAGGFMGLGGLREDVEKLLLPLAEVDDPGYPLEVVGRKMCWWHGSRKELELGNFQFNYSPHQAVAPVARLYRLTAETLSRPQQSVLGPIELECLQKGSDIAFLKVESATGTRPRPARVVQRQAVRPAVEVGVDSPVQESGEQDLEAYLRQSLEQAVGE